MPNANLRILVPEGTTNYITNPSIRNNTTGWNAVSSTISRVLARARFGISSLQVVTNGSALYEGTYFRVSELSGIQDAITVSVYVRGTGRIRIRLIDNPIGKQWISQSIALTDTRWTRVEVSGRCTGRDDMRLYVETADKVQAVTFYVDGAQMERKPYSTTYCDGDQPGCRWNLTANSTQSTRSSYTREGGRWIALAGPCRGDNDVYVTVVGGMGMPPLTNNIQPFSQAPGSFFQNSKIGNRVVTLTFNIKKESLKISRNPSLARLHQLRQELIDILKPDKGLGDEEFTLEYTDGPVPIYLKIRYDAGLDGSWDIRNQWVNSFPVRFLAVYPIMWEDDQEVSSLDFLNDLGNGGAGVFEKTLGRVDGKWTNLNHGMNGNLSGLSFGKNGELYACGLFTTVNNNAKAVNPFTGANRVAVWNGTYWGPLSSGANDTVEAIAVAPNGYVYITGIFTNVGGVACTRVAYWNGSTWNAMGTGLDASGLAILAAPNGDIYVGGSFSTAGGVSANRIARWDGVSWHSVGAHQGVNSPVNALAIKNDGSVLYLGGQFTDENGNPGSGISKICAYDPSTNLLSKLGNGFNANVLGLVISPLSGILYACGDFTLSGSETINHIAMWNGSTWLPLGTGMNASIGDLAINKNENIICNGAFTLAGSVRATGLAFWNGSTWTNIDAIVSKGNIPNYADIKIHPNGDIYIAGGTGFNINSTKASSINLITNTGSASVSPIIYVAGPGNLRWIENQTTKKRVYLDLNILANEEVTFDFGSGKIYSALRGDLSYTVLPGSDFRSFQLVPGENKIACFMIDDVGAVMQISYIPLHWSVDATARGDEP